MIAVTDHIKAAELLDHLFYHLTNLLVDRHVCDVLGTCAALVLISFTNWSSMPALLETSFTATS
jgi:hypothetical protein